MAWGMRKLIVATGNRHKTEEIRAMLGAGWEVTDLSDHPGLPQVEETGSTFLENATLKAVGLSSRVGGLVLADDSGLEVDALGCAPGVFSSRYAGQDGDDEANNAKLLGELQGVVERAARFRCTMVLSEGGEVLAHFDGTVEGRIIAARRGGGGFGYDPLFVPSGHEETFAELGEEVKNGMSHRARAMARVVEWLAERRQEP